MQKAVRCQHQGVVYQRRPFKNDANVFRGDGHNTQARITSIGARIVLKSRCPFGFTESARHVATTTGSALGSRGSRDSKDRLDLLGSFRHCALIIKPFFENFEFD